MVSNGATEKPPKTWARTRCQRRLQIQQIPGARDGLQTLEHRGAAEGWHVWEGIHGQTSSKTIKNHWKPLKNHKKTWKNTWKTHWKTIGSSSKTIGKPQKKIWKNTWKTKLRLALMFDDLKRNAQKICICLGLAAILQLLQRISMFAKP